ncbi:MAG: DUF3800 domain-containing protein [Clostridium sp.]|nr:DUF3800 domain-containing protein [Clostridium sp.]
MFNIYCDESCHLKNDKQKAMVLGAICCDKNKAKEINEDIRKIKIKHGLSRSFEIKWTKVSPGKLNFYKEIIDYFFSNDSLNFRTVVFPNKNDLYYNKYSHDDLYYIMYYYLLREVIHPKHENFIYLDIKDTKSAAKVKKLHDVMCNNIYDFSQDIIKRIQNVRSHECEVLQLTDLLIGAVGYINRGCNESKSKLELVELIKQNTGYLLTKSTLLREQKFNIFVWDTDKHMKNEIERLEEN